MKFEMSIFDNIDHLKNRCIHFIADFLSDQFELALIRLTKCGSKNYMWSN